MTSTSFDDQFAVCTPEEEEAFKAMEVDRVKRWDGEGLPPIGCECEACWLEEPDGGSRDYEVVIFKARYGSYVWFGAQDGQEIVCILDNVTFRPKRTSEQRAEDDAVIAIMNTVQINERRTRTLYAAIRAGKIPGVVLGGGHE